MGFCLCLILILSRPKSRDNLCRSSMIRTFGYVWLCIGFWNKNLSGYNHNQMLAWFIQSKVRTWKSLIVWDISKVWQWHQPRTVDKMHSCAQLTSGNDEVAAKACRIGRTSMFTDLISVPQPLFQDIAVALDCMNKTGCGLWVKERQGFVFLYH